MSAVTDALKTIDEKLRTDGPSLETYVETRFNLVNRDIAEVVEQLRREAILVREEVDRHFELKRQHFTLLEMQVNQRFVSLEQALVARDEKMAAVSQERMQGLNERINAMIAGCNEKFTAGSVLQQSQQEAMREAVSKQERATEIRFESVNEFRQTLTDQAGDFMTRAAFDEAQKASQVYRDGINSRLDILSGRMNIREGQLDGSRETKDDSRANWSMVVAIASVVITVMLTFIPLIGSRHDTPAPVSPLYNVPPGYSLQPMIPAPPTK